MSSKTLEFHFDFGSPTTYLAYTQVPRIAQEAGAMLVWHPMLLGGVFKATGNVSPVTVPAKGRWMAWLSIPFLRTSARPVGVVRDRWPAAGCRARVIVDDLPGA